MMWIILALGAAGAFVAALAGKGSFRTTVGKQYRFSWVLRPPVGSIELAGMAAALSASGAREITTDMSSNLETTGSYVMTAQSSKEIVLGEPSFAIEGKSLTFTNVEEVG